MKNWFKKHDLLKIVLCMITILFILSWIVPGGGFSGATLGETTLFRQGIDDIFRAPYYALTSYFPNILFFIGVGVFCGVLSKTKGYKKLVEKTADLFKNKATIFVLLVTLIFAVYASVSLYALPILIFAPFIISVILHLGLGKVVGVASTFGATILGLLGTTYGDFNANLFQQYIGSATSNDIGIKIMIFVIAYILYAIFMALYIGKVKDSKEAKAEIETDKFKVSKEKLDAKDKVRVWPLVVMFSILFVLVVLGYVAFENTFGVSIFTEFNTWINNLKLGDYNVLRYILGTYLGALGTWDIYIITYMLFIAAIIVKFVYHVKLDELFENAGDGAKKMMRPALFVLLAYTIFVITYTTNLVPVIINWIENLFETFNPIVTSISAFIATLLNVDFGFTGFSLAGFYSAMYPDFTNLIVMIFTSINGLASLIVPSSIFLLAGLSYADISYKKWVKYIWKFILSMLAALIVIFVVMAYI